jgi:hypothetical protein
MKFNISTEVKSQMKSWCWFNALAKLRRFIKTHDVNFSKSDTSCIYWRENNRLSWTVINCFNKLSLLLLYQLMIDCEVRVLHIPTVGTSVAPVHSRYVPVEQKQRPGRKFVNVSVKGYFCYGRRKGRRGSFLLAACTAYTALACPFNFASQSEQQQRQRKQKSEAGSAPVGCSSFLPAADEPNR